MTPHTAPRADLDIDALLAEIVPGYLEARARELPELRAVVARGDHELVTARGHKIAGGAASLRLFDVADAARRLEDAGAHSDLEAAARALDALALALAQAAR